MQSITSFASDSITEQLSLIHIWFGKSQHLRPKCAWSKFFISLFCSAQIWLCDLLLYVNLKFYHVSTDFLQFQIWFHNLFPPEQAHYSFLLFVTNICFVHANLNDIVTVLYLCHPITINDLQWTLCLFLKME